MKIAYLINQYPKVSHSFIRREIRQLESMGIAIARFSVRSCPEKLVDEVDKKELEKTKVILNVGFLELLSSLLKIIFIKPFALIKALILTFKIGWKSERGLFLHLIYLAEACVLLGWLNQEKISHIHAHFGTNSTTVAMLCHVLGNVTYSFTVHGPEEFDKPQFISLPEKIKRALFVIAISSFGKSQLYRWCDYQHWSKIHVVHCGLDDSFWQISFQAITQDNRLVCVGRLCEQKGQLLLLEAASKLVAKGLDFKLILVGDGELRNVIEELIKTLKLDNYVEITGWASGNEVQQQIINSKALVLPSFAEGLPVVIMEALALGRPVISTFVAGIPELVIPGKCGWLVMPGEVEELANAMENVLKLSPEELEIMGNIGIETVAKQHNLSQEVQRLASLFPG